MGLGRVTTTSTREAMSTTQSVRIRIVAGRSKSGIANTYRLASRGTGGLGFVTENPTYHASGQAMTKAR